MVSQLLSSRIILVLSILPSRRSRSGSQNSALANANLILHPPEKVLVA